MKPDILEIKTVDVLNDLKENVTTKTRNGKKELK